MFWADKILQDRKNDEWVNDAFTPSGIAHIGSLKGPVIHDTVNKVIRGQGRTTKFTFGFDDFDPIDGLPDNLQEKLGAYMGIPICSAPSPEGSGTFGEYYADRMRSLFASLGIEAEIYLASDYYRWGVYDDAIRFVLDNADKIRKVYSEMYSKEISPDWFPLQVVCPHCGKLGTTKVTGWDGEKVKYECSKTLVKWAEGCGNIGMVSPFKGNAKMAFKVEWAAKWWTFGVTIEGAGKDHASAGGTYDIARKLVKEVFGKEPPLWLPYEFFLYDGKKMSSSKGLGLTGEALLEVLPPEIVRFLMIKTEPNQAVEFNPFETQIIPKLYDEYQEYAAHYFENKKDDYARAFELSKISEIKKPPSLRFSKLVQLVQMPNGREEIEKEGAHEWAKYAKVWVEKYAPEKDKFLVQKDLPDLSSLSAGQKKYLSELSAKLEGGLTPENIQQVVYGLSKEMEVKSLDAFRAIYVSLLGKDHGPKASELIASLDIEFVKNRFSEAAA